MTWPIGIFSRRGRILDQLAAVAACLMLVAGSRLPAGAVPFHFDQAQEAADAAQQQPAPAHTRRVEMRLSGSTCVACLNDLQGKIGKAEGILKVKIDFPAGNMRDYLMLPGAATAAATIVYDPEHIDLENIKALIRTLGYRPFKVVDKPGT